jgi:hypothetical protein
MATYSLWDPGGCNCAGAACNPCSLPLSNLTMSNTDSAGDSGTTTMVYGGIVGGYYTWTGGCVNTPLNPGSGKSNKCVLTCAVAGGDTRLTVSLWTSPGCPGVAPSVTYWDSSGGSTGVLVSHTCSPLNIVWTCPSAFWTWTLTL